MGGFAERDYRSVDNSTGGRCGRSFSAVVLFNAVVLDKVRFSGAGFSLLRFLITKKMARTTSVTSITAPTTMPAIAPLDKLSADLADELSAGGVADVVIDAVLEAVAGVVEDSVGRAVVFVVDIVCWFISVGFWVYSFTTYCNRR